MFAPLGALPSVLVLRSVFSPSVFNRLLMLLALGTLPVLALLRFPLLPAPALALLPALSLLVSKDSMVDVPGMLLFVKKIALS